MKDIRSEWKQRKANGKRFLVVSPKRLLALLENTHSDDDKRSVLQNLISILTDYAFIEIVTSSEAEAFGGGVEVLISYYADTLVKMRNFSDFKNELDVLTLIQQSLSASKNEIEQDNSALPQSLYGYLMTRITPGISEFLEQIREQDKLWLCPLSSPEITLGHSNSKITALQPTLDGKTVVSVAEDYSIRSWNLSKTASEGAVLRFPHSAFALTPKGACAIIGDADGTLIVEDCISGDNIIEYTNLHSQPITSIVISSDFRWLATTAKDNILNIIDLRAKSITLSAFSQPKAITSMVFSLDSKKLLFGTEDGFFKIRNISSGDEQSLLVFNNQPVTSIVPIPTYGKGKDSCYAVSSSSSISIFVIEVDTKSFISTLNAPSGEIVSLCTALYGKLIISASKGGTLRLWDWMRREEVAHFNHKNSLTVCTVEPIENRKLIIGDSFGRIQFFAIEGWKDRTPYELPRPASVDEKQLLSKALSIPPKTRKRPSTAEQEPEPTPIRQQAASNIESIPSVKVKDLPKLAGAIAISGSLVALLIVLRFNTLISSNISSSSDPITETDDKASTNTPLSEIVPPPPPAPAEITPDSEQTIKAPVPPPRKTNASNLVRETFSHDPLDPTPDAIPRINAENEAISRGLLPLPPGDAEECQVMQSIMTALEEKSVRYGYNDNTIERRYKLASDKEGKEAILQQLLDAQISDSLMLKIKNGLISNLSSALPFYDNYINGSYDWSEFESKLRPLNTEFAEHQTLLESYCQ